MNTSLTLELRTGKVRDTISDSIVSFLRTISQLIHKQLEFNISAYLDSVRPKYLSNVSLSKT